MVFFNRRIPPVLIFLLLMWAAGRSQIINVDEAIFSTSDRSYISFGQGLGNYKTPYGVKRLNPLIFEGSISPDFFVSLSKKKNMGLAFFPKIVVRMFNANSFPVKTPSYMPSALFYHQVKWPFQRKVFSFFKSEKQLAFMTYRAIHHSNGQDGNYYLPLGDTVNYTNGNFSTNALEVAFSWSSIDSGRVGKAFMNGRVAYERQLDFEREDNLHDSYYYNKITLEGRFIYSEKIKAYVTYGFMWGTRKFGTRHAIDIFCAVKPFHKLSDFSVFIRAYAGPDYYNLYYVNILRAVTFGIIADPLSIPVLRRARNNRK